VSTLTTIEKQRFEELLGMRTGYVLNFSDRTFGEFFRHDVGLNIDEPRFAVNGSSKAKRLRTFWDTETPNNVGKALEKLLEVWRYLNESSKNAKMEKLYLECMTTAARLLGRQIRQESEDDFLKKSYDAVSLKGLYLDSPLESVLLSRIQEAERCVRAGTHLSAVILCGSILEGVLLSAALQYPKRFNQATTHPKQKDSSRTKPVHEWSLANLIDVAHEVGAIRMDVKKYGHALREFRKVTIYLDVPVFLRRLVLLWKTSPSSRLIIHLLTCLRHCPMTGLAACI
jgi:hypothetical protein